MTDKGEPREKAGGRVVLLVILGLALLVGGGYAAAYAFAGDKVPRGTTVAGIDIGGRTEAEAVQALEEGLADRVDAPIDVTVDGSDEQVAPEAAGLSVDLQATVEAAGGGRSWDPQRLWSYYTGGDELAPVVEVDEAAMTRALDELTADVGTPARDGNLVFEGSEVRVVKPRTGERIDPEEAREEIVAAYLADGDAAELDLTPAAPDIDEADVQEALDTFANPALSGPVTLVFGQSPVTLAPREFGAVLGVKAQDGELVPEVDAAALEQLVQGTVGAEGAPEDATVRLVKGKPKVVPAKPGVTYDPAAIADTFLTLVTSPEGSRQLEVESTVTEPEFTTKDARKLKIKEKVSSFTTYYPPAAYRDTNIGRAAEIIDGTVLKPGETFSLNDIVGERTAENGFTEGFVISDGILVEDLGGGVSQMATTLFNAMFFAGLEDVEHKPHSFYIDRYPVGREATVAWGAVDLRFRNDTPYGVLIDTNLVPSAGRSRGEVTVTMYSTKVWDIESVTGNRYNFTQPKTRTLRTENCHPNSGYGGFDIDVKRIFRKPGSDEVVKTENFHTTYTPSDTVICKPPRAERQVPTG